MKNKDLKKRIIEISYKHKLSHIGSCLTAVDIIDEIYATKKFDEKFVLSSGHAGVALYVVLEKYYDWEKDQSGIGYYRSFSAEKRFEHHGIHPDRCKKCHLDCSSGSLGNGLPIAVGMALADRSKNVYCVVSDGELAEGSIWEALRIAKDHELSNLIIMINDNGWGAYDKSSRISIDLLRAYHAICQTYHYNEESYENTHNEMHYDNYLKTVLQEHANAPLYRAPLIIVAKTSSNWVPFLKDLQGHYVVMNEQQYKEALACLG